MQFRVLGPLEVDAGSGPLPLGGPKQRAVLANLLVRANEVVPADVLIEEVWGDDPPGQARNTLQTYVSNLRKSIGDGALQHRPPGYVLVVDPIDVDATRFDALVRDARATLAVDPGVAVDTLEDALAMWRGPALADVADRSLLAEAARLDELRLEAQEERIGALLATGAAARAIGELEPMVAQHPLRERLWEQLMLALYREGRQGEALGAFQRAREILADELGIDPSPELARLHTQILAQDPALELRGEPLRGYRLLERVDPGRHGPRFRAVQPRVGRDVTVEVYPEEIAASEAFVERFEREAQAVAALEHPHIVPVYDYWREPGRAYVVTRFLRGSSRAVDDSADRALALDVVEQVAAALAFAHRRGVAHGDVGMQNVAFDAEGNAYLGGFAMGAGPPPTRAEDVAELASLARHLLRTDMPAALEAVVDDAGAGDAVDAQSLLDAVRASRAGVRAAAVVTPAADARNPYRGLRAFTEADALDFFGRAASIREILDRLREPVPGSRFLAVVGPSGCGKSSIVRAGVVPELRRTTADGRAVLVAELTPGRHPFDELEAALGRIAVHGVRRLGAVLHGGSRGLIEAVQRAVPGDAGVLLVVDQLEELFTLTTDEDERASFLECLRVAAVDPDSRVRVVATLRADFYDRPLVYPRFGELLAARTQAVPPMQPDELEQAIVGPAERAGVPLAPGLAAEMIGDATHEPGALPLVQFALTELFDRRVGGEMRLQTYRDLGGIVGAVATSADAIARGATGEERRATREVFLRLVTLGEGRSDTRRRVTRRALDALDLEPGTVDGVLETFGRHRILTFDRQPATREPTVEIAHEALLDAWPRLRSWIDAAREDLQRERLLSRAASEWTAADKDPSFLLRGARLEQVEQWAAGSALSIDTGERAYVAASVAARDEEAAVEERRRDHERRIERRSARRLRGLVAVFAVAALVAGSLTLVATGQSERAGEQAAVARVRELAAASVASLDTDPERSIMLAVAAVEQSRATSGSVLPEAMEALHRAVSRSRLLLTVPGYGGAVSVSRDGTMAAEAVDQPGWVGVIDAGGEVQQRFQAHPSELDDLALTPDGQVLLTIADDGWLRAWDVNTGGPLWRVHRPQRVPPEDVWAEHLLSIDAAGDLVVASWPEAERIDVRSVATGALQTLYECSSKSCQGALLPDGERIAVASGYLDVDTPRDKGIEAGWIGRLRGGARIPFQAPPWVGINGKLAWSPDGHYISGSAFVWRTATGHLVHSIEHGYLVGPTSWSKDGRRLASGSGATFKVWRVGPHELRETFTLSTEASPSSIEDLEFTPDGRRLVTASDAVRVWDARPIGAAEHGSLDLSTSYTGDLVFTSQGDLVIGADASDSEAGVTVWNPDEVEATAVLPRSLLPAGPFSANPVDGSIVGFVTRDDGDDDPDNNWTGLVSSSRGVLPFKANDFGWAPDGVHLITAAGRTVSLVDLSGEAVWRVRQPFKVGVLTVGADGRVVVGEGDFGPDPRTIVLDGATGAPLYTLSVPAHVTRIALDPRGRQAVLQTEESAPLQVWDLASGRQVGAYPASTFAGGGFAFSPDGSTMAMIGVDQVTRLFDTETRQLRYTLPAPDELLGDLPARDGGDPRCGASAVAFNTDGSLLATQGCAGVRVWELDVDRLLTVARSRVTRSFTTDECAQYFRADPCPTI